MSAKGVKVPKSLIYKRANFHTQIPNKSLKGLLESAFKKKATVGERRRNISAAENPIYHLIGSRTVEPKNGFVFGALMTYTPGSDPIFLVDDAQANDVLLEKLKAPSTEDGKRREVLESLMYFGVIGNHLVLMQSQALKAPQLETYLQWLLHQSEVLAGDNTIMLIDTPSETVRKKMEAANGVRTIVLGADVLPPGAFPSSASEATSSDAQAPAAGATAASSSAKTHLVNVMADGDFGVLAALKRLMHPAQAAKINFDELAGSNIEMSVTLRYKRETTDKGQELMNTLGVALRNTEEVETQLRLVGGGIIKGTELKIKGPVSVTSYDGQLDSTEVYEVMRQWLLSKISSEEIPAS